MLSTIKRLFLGLGLIVLASAVLLIADWSRRPGSSQGKGPGRAPGVAKKWRIHYIQYAEERTAEDVEKGFFDEMKKLGMEQGKAFDVRRGSAQRDMSTLINLVDEAKSSADLVILVSTPTLQTAIQRIHDTPMVFTNSGAPLQAGAGKSFKDHLPNVTGVCVISDFEGALRAVKRVLPGVKRIGTLYTPAEVNSVVYESALEEAASAQDLEVVAVPVASTADVADAALALIARGVDAVCQISDNTVTPAYGAVAQAAHKQRVPLFGFVSGQVIKEGAILARCRDYEQAGRDAAMLAARVMRGEKTADIPIQMVSRTLLVVSPKNAADNGITLPPDLVKEADVVVP